jgi:putative FmdB family regulatory protein
LFEKTGRHLPACFFWYTATNLISKHYFPDKHQEGRMPIYDYRCEGCNKIFELLVKASTTPSCPACGSAQLEKLVSLPAAPGQTAEFISRARSQAAREGHFSNYKASERPRK